MISSVKTHSASRSITSSSVPAVCIAGGQVSRPSVTAFITITIVGDSISGNPTLGAVFHVDDLSLSGVSAAGESSPEIPGDMTLAQNFPNPFNPTTRIDFRTTEAGPVTLRVYDLLGREVATLVDESLFPGVHSRSFDASAIPSGMYLYRLTAGGRSESRKMMLLR